jgi:hypothetical protein
LACFDGASSESGATAWLAESDVLSLIPEHAGGLGFRVRFREMNYRRPNCVYREEWMSELFRPWVEEGRANRNHEFFSVCSQRDAPQYLDLLWYLHTVGVFSGIEMGVRHSNDMWSIRPASSDYPMHCGGRSCSFILVPWRPSVESIEAQDRGEVDALVVYEQFTESGFNESLVREVYENARGISFSVYDFDDYSGDFRQIDFGDYEDWVDFPVRGQNIIGFREFDGTWVME